MPHSVGRRARGWRRFVGTTGRGSPRCGPLRPRLKYAAELADAPGVHHAAAVAATLSRDGADVGLQVAKLLAQLGIFAAFVLANIYLALVLQRRRIVRRLTRQFPDKAAEIRGAINKGPVRLRSAPAPADPYARTHRIVIVPHGDGRPGESFWAPGPAKHDGTIGPDGSRTDATVALSPGTYMLVVCLGRVGSTWRDHEVKPAAERVEEARAHYVPPKTALGPVDRVPTAAGLGWRTTCTYGSGHALTDTHFDRDGWAFIVGVLSATRHARAVEALDAILATWRWIPVHESPEQS